VLASWRQSSRGLNEQKDAESFTKLNTLSFQVENMTLLSRALLFAMLDENKIKLLQTVAVTRSAEGALDSFELPS